MASVNIKSKAKKAKRGWGWYRYSFFFRSFEDCNRMALPIAACLRTRLSKLYFARYTNAREARLDVVGMQRNSNVLTQEHVNALMAAGGTCWRKIVGPTPCEGSLAHAAAFDFVAVFTAYAELQQLDAEGKHALWLDVLHWAHNMAGYDYVDEARSNLWSIQKILNIFEQSIKLGTTAAKLTKVTRKRARRGDPRNN